MFLFFPYSFVSGADYDDRMTSGQRNPFQARWKVGVSKDGMLQVLDADVYNNAGYSPLWTVHLRTWTAATGFLTSTSAVTSARQTPTPTLLSVALAPRKDSTLRNVL